VFGIRRSYQPKKSDASSRALIPILALRPCASQVVLHLGTVRTRLYQQFAITDPPSDHVGVAKAFLDAGLMPRVHSGTSAGGVLAALICTRTDDELRGLLCPELARRITAFEEPFSVWSKRVWKTGARFDGVHWARKVWVTSQCETLI
jgi:hypothetical protein